MVIFDEKHQPRLNFLAACMLVGTAVAKLCAVLQNLQVKAWEAVFYDDEPDPTPPFARETPRLD